MITVNELNKRVKKLLEKKFKKEINVIGEISNAKLSGNNLYMTLKDKYSKINVVCWNYAINFEGLVLNDGDEVIVKGDLVHYHKGGYYQISATGFTLKGVGDLHQKYTLLKEKFEKENYFDIANKKDLPDYISNIAVVTAKHGAALKDFLYVLKRNNYKGRVHIKYATVQGKYCPNNIKESIEMLDPMGFDAIVITRGGGSIEDLFGFSSEEVVKAIYNANTPIISAIGHEVDHMLSDFVADIRAPTPSIAGEVIAANYFNIATINNLFRKVYTITLKKYYNKKNSLQTLSDKLISPEHIVSDYQKLLNTNTFEDTLRCIHNDYTQTLNNLHYTLQSTNPQNIMSKGYCLITSPNDILITTLSELKKHKKLKLQLSDGTTIHIPKYTYTTTT